jgi:hypothetical protein
MSIALSLGNNLTTGGIFKPTAVNNTSVNNVTDFAGIAGGGTLILIIRHKQQVLQLLFHLQQELIVLMMNTYLSLLICTQLLIVLDLQFNFSTDGGSSYNVTKTSTFFHAHHNEADTVTTLSYVTARDLGQSTSYQTLGYEPGSDNDQSASGYLHLFNPSSTTYVKHFISTINTYDYDDYSKNAYIAGYGNTTSAINAIDFKFSSGNIDDGIIKMYGLVKS